MNELVIVKNNGNIKAAGNPEAINALLPVFESHALEEYERKIALWKQRRKFNFIEQTESARINYAVRKPTLPERVFWGCIGLVVVAVNGFFKSVIDMSRNLTACDEEEE